MNIMLVSQCRKGALAETRRILDQFAERRGDQVWQTAITQAGLETLRRLLRKSARKNTAVACHWIRGLNHSELLWIVGDRSSFNEQGAVPTGSTKMDMLKAGSENNWHNLCLIRLLAGLAALWHDMGKACAAFQKLLSRRPAPNERFQQKYRHEWVSLRLFQAFVGADDDATWLKRLADLEKDCDLGWLKRLRKDGLDAQATASPPLRDLASRPLAVAVAWRAE